MPITRRGFLSAAAAIGAGAFVHTHASSARAGMLRARNRGAVYRKALKIGMIAEGETLADKFRIARDAGFAGVELDAPGSYATAEITEAKQSTGVSVPGVVNSVHWAKPLNHPDESVREEGIAGLEQAIRDCDAWADEWVGEGDGVGRTVLLVPAVVNKEMGYADARARSIDAIKRVLPLARERRVRIAIENVWNEFLLSPTEAAGYVDELNELADAPADNPVVGWYLDIGNIWRYGWPEHWVQALGTRVMRLDLKGYSRSKADKEGKWAGFGVELDEGDLDWGAVRAALDEIGYAGWAVAEVAGGDATRLNDISARMDRALGT